MCDSAWVRVKGQLLGVSSCLSPFCSWFSLVSVLCCTLHASWPESFWMIFLSPHIWLHKCWDYRCAQLPPIGSLSLSRIPGMEFGLSESCGHILATASALHPFYRCKSWGSKPPSSRLHSWSRNLLPDSFLTCPAQQTFLYRG